MKEITTSKHLQRMHTRPTSGSVVGTTIAEAVPRVQVRGDRLPSKLSILPAPP